MPHGLGQDEACIVKPVLKVHKSIHSGSSWRVSFNFKLFLLFTSFVPLILWRIFIWLGAPGRLTLPVGRSAGSVSHPALQRYITAACQAAGYGLFATDVAADLDSNAV
ncbi:hypothetical protein GQ42DRAFT_88881 [Ramicandelaber brevisporus]|nr:hypothetical protein GQ42DRAFT_88881 [Ramicandelaber brevisporus]